MIRLYLDHNVHSGITEGLRDRGVDVLTAAEDGMDRADDEAILKRATELSRVVFTQDVDFLAISHDWMEKALEFSGVIYARQMGITIGEAIRDLELMATLLEPEEIRNRIEWIPL